MTASPARGLLPTTVGGAFRMIGTNLGSCCGGMEPYESPRIGMLHVHTQFQALQRAVFQAHQAGSGSDIDVINAAMSLAAAATRMALYTTDQIILDRDAHRKASDD